MVTFASNIEHDQSNFEPVQDDSFYPPVSIQEYTQQHRTHQSILPAQLHKLLVDAVYYVQDNLSDYRQRLVMLAQQDNSDIPVAIENDTSGNQKSHHYKNAVYYYLAALVIQNYRDDSATSLGHDRAESNDTQADEYLRRHWENMRRISGKPSMDAELI